MIAKYKGGRSIPDNVLAALRYIGKVGVMTKTSWNELFSHGGDRWKRKQLFHLINRGLIQVHSCGSVDQAYVLTSYGEDLVSELKLNCVIPIPPQFIKHDETVAVSLIKLERLGLCQNWFTERELKSLQLKEYMVQNKDGEFKYPDAIFKIMIQGKLRTVALEYERTGKSFARYRSILWQYNGINNISMILYIVENQVIKSRIKKSLKFLGNAGLLERIAFMDADKWKADPARAEIELKSKLTSFENLCRKNAM